MGIYSLNVQINSKKPVSEGFDSYTTHGYLLYYCTTAVPVLCLEVFGAQPSFLYQLIETMLQSFRP